MSTPGIEHDAVTFWLSRTRSDVRPPLTFVRIGAGRSNLTYLVEDASGARLVLRRPPLGVLLESAHDMAREHRVLSALAAQGLPVPRPLALCTDSVVTGAPFYVMQHLDGVVVADDEAAGTVGLAARARAGTSLATTLAALHDVDVDTAGLGDLGRRNGYAERQLRRWSRQWEQSKTREIAAIDRVAAALQDAVPPQRETTLVHGDYNLANVILSQDGDVRAVLDWELCTLGDPIADLGTLVCYWPDTPEQATLERDPVALLPGFASRQDLIEAYHCAAPQRDLAHLAFWTALASWKLAIILQGVHRRWMHDSANGGQDAGGFEHAVDRMAAVADSIIKQW